MMSLCPGDSRFPAETSRRFLGPCFRAGLALVAAVPALAGMACRAADAGPVVQPPSKWVVPRTFDRPPADEAADPSQDYRWLLSDRQINPQTDEQFVHEVRQPLTLAGVDFGSHILIHYDPACQSLTFHWARLWRGTNKLDRLDPSRMRVSQPAQDREQFLFSSEKTAILLLDDVRAGDIVDYAYTIEGSNPALDGKFFDTVQLQFGEPVARAVTRLVWPPSRRLYLKNHLTELQPARKGGDFTWDVRQAPALRLESLTPVWYDPYPWVQLSEFQKWSDVNRWALRLFTTTNQPSPEFKRKISEWNKLPEPAQRVLAALRFAQEEIRNLGMEDGPAGNEPAQPSVVFARRYGDGKAKAFLLVTMLRALKIEAFPVLVNDHWRQALAEFLPSPVLFNHVIVQVNLGGQSFWLEPAAAYERGALALRAWPSYGWGLVVGPGVTGLTPIPPCPVQPLTSVVEYLNLGPLDTESIIKIVTVAEGPDANALRQRFATTPREEFERENLNDYARFYPFIRRTAPLLYADDEQQNRVETTEFYAVGRIWSRLPDEAGYHCLVYGVNVDDALVKPAASFRTMPLEIRYPVHQIFHAEMNMNRVLPLDTGNLTINDPAFYFKRVSSVVGNALFLDYEYRSWTDALAPNAVPGYVHDLDSATVALGYTLAGWW